MMVFLPESPRSQRRNLTGLVLALSSLAIGAFQIMLDLRRDQVGSVKRNRHQALVASATLYLFLVHTFTAEHPFGISAVSRSQSFRRRDLQRSRFHHPLRTTALQPYLQDLMNYQGHSPPVSVMGFAWSGTMIGTIIVGRFVGKVDTRLLLAIGLGFSAWAFHDT